MRIAIARAAMIQGVLALSDHQRAVESFQDLQHQINSRALSACAHSTINRLAQQLETQITSLGDHVWHSCKGNL